MKSLIIILSTVLVCSRKYHVGAFNLPGPRVYVVTPSPRPLQIDEGRSVPFYYHNWMRRMDNDVAVQNATTSTTTEVPKSPDLIFAEFESDSMKKSIRKLLEKEKVVPKTTTTTTTTTTSSPIYVPNEDFQKVTRVVTYGVPTRVNQDETVESKPDYFSMYNKMYENPPSPVFLPSTQSTTMKTTTTSTTPESSKVENIWHIIDNEKTNHYSGNWEEVPVETDQGDQQMNSEVSPEDDKITEHNDDEDKIDENFALPGLGTNPGNGAENESRAIRTEPNIRFPYVNLKPFQIKLNKKPTSNFFMDKKKSHRNLTTSLDNFHELKNPVRGEAQDVNHMRDLIDRYNPAQPYLPPSDYGSKISKQNSNSSPPKASANLVPPPPPLAPAASDNDFPVLTNYEAFPPYAPFLDSAPPSFDSAPPSYDSAPPAPRPSPPKPPSPTYTMPSVETSDDSDSDSDNTPDSEPPTKIKYVYERPSPSIHQFYPTVPPLSETFNGYSYDKPPMMAESPMMPSMDDKPEFHGYHYSKPEPAPPPSEPMPPSYGSLDPPPSYGHDSDSPELMIPKFPGDFPDDSKYHHDFDDHDFYHHHHHHPTTTTEMPRVNRYSYYYLGKKLYYLPLYFSVYFIVYVGALIIKAVLRHKIVYPNSWRPNDQTASFFSKRSVDSYLSNDNMHELTGRVTHAIATAAEKYLGEDIKPKK